MVPASTWNRTSINSTVGGLVFLVGLVYAARQGYVGLRGAGLRNLLILLGGLAFYMGLHGYLQFGTMNTAEPVPHDGSFERKKILGSRLDYGIMVTYFLVILAVGTWFGRRQKTIKDFFFGGQRFSWWLISLSLVGNADRVVQLRQVRQCGLQVWPVEQSELHQ